MERDSDLSQRDEVIASMRRKYVWWASAADSAPSERVVAQVMNIGTYEDLLRLEDAVGADFLTGVMRNAAPGWFSERSWSLWRDRLDLVDTLPEGPPKRALLATDL